MTGGDARTAIHAYRPVEGAQLVEAFPQKSLGQERPRGDVVRGLGTPRPGDMPGLRIERLGLSAEALTGAGIEQDSVEVGRRLGVDDGQLPWADLQ